MYTYPYMPPPNPACSYAPAAGKCDAARNKYNAAPGYCHGSHGGGAPVGYSDGGDNQVGRRRLSSVEARVESAEIN